MIDPPRYTIKPKSGAKREVKVNEKFGKRFSA